MSVREHSAPSATGEHFLQWKFLGALANSKSLHKCALWGLRGRTPYKSCGHRVGLLIKFRCGRSVTASPRTGNVLTSTFDVPPSQVIRSCRSVGTLLLTPHSFCLASRLLLFLSRNMIFYQRQNGRAAPYMEDHQEVDHL